MSKKRKQKKTPNLPAPIRSKTALDKLAEAAQLAKDGDWEEAAVILEELARRRPNDVAVWEFLGEAYYHLDDYLHLWYVSQRLLQLTPKEPVNWYNAMGVAARNGLFFCARYYARYFLEHWPDHEKAATMRSGEIEFDRLCHDALANEPLLAAAKEEDLMAFERGRILVEIGRVAEGRQASLQAAKNLPRFAGPLNNLALSYLVEGRFAEAESYCRQVLDFATDNIHALSNLTQSLARRGKVAEAKPIAEQLRSQVFTDASLWLKQLEAFAYLGDDATICELYERDHQQFPITADSLPLPHHFAAVSFARLGDVNRARKIWQNLLHEFPDFQVASAGLADLASPPGERDGAWHFPIGNWLPEVWMTQLSAKQQRNDERSVVQGLKKFLRQHPEVEPVLPILLERGDPNGRQFALLVAAMLELPILRDFALSQNGRDADRIQAFNAAAQAGLLPRGEPTSIYQSGELVPLVPIAYEIYDETQPAEIPAAAQDLLEAAHAALVEKNGAKALSLAESALQLAPDHPPLLNYRTAALKLLRRDAEAAAVTRYTLEKHPDYFFARCERVELLIQEKRLAEAREQLNALACRERLHISEFRALSLAQIHLAIAAKHYDAARSWLDMWEDVLPDDPDVTVLRDHLVRQQMGESLLGALGKLKNMTGRPLKSGRAKRPK